MPPRAPSTPLRTSARSPPAALDPLGDLRGGLRHYAVGAAEPRRLAILRERGPIFERRTAARSGHVHHAVARRKPSRHLDRGRALAGRPLRIEDPRAVSLVPVHAGDRPVAGPALSDTLEVVGVRLKRQPPPHPPGAGGGPRLHARAHP